MARAKRLRVRRGVTCVVRERSGFPRTDRAFGTGDWDAGECRVLPIGTARRLCAAFPDLWQDITRKWSIPGTVCATEGCTYEAYPVGDQRHCRLCWLRERDAQRKLNRARGLCKCGRELPPGFRNCDLCRSADRRRQRRYRARRRRERMAA